MCDERRGLRSMTKVNREGVYTGMEIELDGMSGTLTGAISMSEDEEEGPQVGVDWADGETTAVSLHWVDAGHRGFDTQGVRKGAKVSWTTDNGEGGEHTIEGVLTGKISMFPEGGEPVTVLVQWDEKSEAKVREPSVSPTEIPLHWLELVE